MSPSQTTMHTSTTPRFLISVSTLRQNFAEAGTGWSFDEIGVYDLSADSTAGFRDYLRGQLEQSGAASRITVHDSAEQLIRSSDLVVFATVAAAPHVSDPSWFQHIRWCCTCRCATSPRRSCLPRPTSSTTSSTA